MIDDLDMAGLAYILTEYDTLVRFMEEVPDHEGRTFIAKEKMIALALHWAAVRGVATWGPDTVSMALADAHEYRAQHPGDTLAYLARSEQN